MFSVVKRFCNRSERGIYSIKMASSKLLLMFDFDKTIIDDNVDTWVTKLLPNGKVPQDIKSEFKKHNSWTRYMGDIFSRLHQLGVRKMEMLESVRGVPFTSGMLDLLKYQEAKSSIDAIIVSDANTLFIGHIMQEAGLHGTYKAIFSNPAEFDAEECIHIKHHHQHQCTRCPENLCKGTVVKDYILKCRTDGIFYDRVVVIGDGFNDFCPCVGLRQNDIIFPRKGYRLMEEIEQCLKGSMDGSGASDSCGVIKATVVPWDKACEIQKHLEGLIN